MPIPVAVEALIRIGTRDAGPGIKHSNIRVPVNRRGEGGRLQLGPRVSAGCRLRIAALFDDQLVAVGHRTDDQGLGRVEAASNGAVGRPGGRTILVVGDEQDEGTAGCADQIIAALRSHRSAGNES